MLQIRSLEVRRLLLMMKLRVEPQDWADKVSRREEELEVSRLGW